jgi:hypothetical protein
MRQRSALALPMPAAYFRLLLRRYGGSPTAAAALVADTDVDPEHLAASGEITLGQQLTQFRNLAAREAPGWGLDAGSGFEASTHGPLGFACASAPTLGAALDVLARFAHVRSPFYRVVPAEGSAKSFRLAVLGRDDINLPIGFDQLGLDCFQEGFDREAPRSGVIDDQRFTHGANYNALGML